MYQASIIELWVESFISGTQCYSYATTISEIWPLDSWKTKYTENCKTVKLIVSSFTGNKDIKNISWPPKVWTVSTTEQCMLKVITNHNQNTLN